MLELLHSLLDRQVRAIEVPARDLDPLAHFLKSFLQSERIEQRNNQEGRKDGLLSTFLRTHQTSDPSSP
jgi:hypothetical protein